MLKKLQNVFFSASLYWKDAMDAAGDGDTEAVIALIERGFDVNAVDTRPKTTVRLVGEPGEPADLGTMMHRAAEGGHVATIIALIERGADMNAKDYYGGTPLHRAAQEGAVDAIRTLLDHGANVEAKDNGGRTPLYWAAGSGHAAAVSALLQRGAKPEIIDSTGKTAADWAAGKDRIKIADEIRQAKSVRHERLTKSVKLSRTRHCPA